MVINRTCGAEIIQDMINRIFRIYKIDGNSKLITVIDDLGKVKNMLETRAKKWEKEVWEKGREQGVEQGRVEGREQGRVEGIEQTALNMIKNNEPEEKIVLYTGLSMEQIAGIREKIKKKK